MHAYIFYLLLLAEAYIALYLRGGPQKILCIITSVSSLNCVLVSMSLLISFPAISGPAPSHLLMDMVKSAVCSPLWTIPTAY